MDSTPTNSNPASTSKPPTEKALKNVPTTGTANSTSGGGGAVLTSTTGTSSPPPPPIQTLLNLDGLANAGNGPITIKAKYGEEVRRLSPIHNEELTFTELQVMMQRVFKLRTSDELQIRYTDADGDLVTIADDNDLTTALRDYRTLRITLTVNGKPRPLDSEQVKWVRRELQQVRDRVNTLLDSLDPETAPPSAHALTNGPTASSASRNTSAGSSGGRSGPSGAASGAEKREKEQRSTKERERDKASIAGEFDPLATNAPPPTSGGAALSNLQLLSRSEPQRAPPTSVPAGFQSNVEGTAPLDGNEVLPPMGFRPSGQPAELQLQQAPPLLLNPPHQAGPAHQQGPPHPPPQQQGPPPQPFMGSPPNKPPQPSLGGPQQPPPPPSATLSHSYGPPPAQMPQQAASNLPPPPPVGHGYHGPGGGYPPPGMSGPTSLPPGPPQAASNLPPPPSSSSALQVGPSLAAAASGQYAPQRPMFQNSGFNQPPPPSSSYAPPPQMSAPPASSYQGMPPSAGRGFEPPPPQGQMLPPPQQNQMLPPPHTMTQGGYQQATLMPPPPPAAPQQQPQQYGMVPPPHVGSSPQMSGMYGPPPPAQAGANPYSRYPQPGAGPRPPLVTGPTRDM